MYLTRQCVCSLCTRLCIDSHLFYKQSWYWLLEFMLGKFLFWEISILGRVKFMYVVMLKWMGRWDWWTVEVKVNGECWWLNGESNVMNHNRGMLSKVQLWAGKADTFGFGVTFSNPSFCRKRNLFLTWGKFGLKSLALSQWVLFTRKDAFSEKAQIFHCPLFTNHLFSESSLVRRSFLGLSVINFTTTDPHQFYNVKGTCILSCSFLPHSKRSHCVCFWQMKKT